MNRRRFIASALASAAGTGLYGHCAVGGLQKTFGVKARPLNYAYEDNKVTFRLQGLKEPVRIIHITDTHLWMDDGRGEPFLGYSSRMAGAYHVTRHFRTGAETNPERSFVETLDHAVESKADLVAFTGDMLSFPSEAGVEWMLNELQKRALPFMYTAGNHDWHYEGMQGSSRDLRKTWTGRRLAKLYQGNDPLMAARQLKGIKVLMVDDSIYDLLPEQVDILAKHEREGVPFLLMLHIPLYAPGKGYGVGDPAWGAAKDDGYELERRERWPETGHLTSTFKFHEQLFNSGHALGVFAGHTHERCLDVINGIPQFVTPANATGAFTQIDLVPLQ